MQDYHFALLPRMIRERLPKATIITFWHIPWPNPEAFAICPWRVELLDGLLGSSILGFHTQFHCNNFLDTVDRLLEARVDRETFTVVVPRQSHRRASLSDLDRMAARAARDARRASPTRARARARALQACRAITGSASASSASTTRRASSSASTPSRACSSCEPQWIGRFTFVQIAAPSRGTIGDYRDYAARVRALADGDQRALRGREASADRPARRASRARCRLRVPPRVPTCASSAACTTA